MTNRHQAYFDDKSVEHFRSISKAPAMARRAEIHRCRRQELTDIGAQFKDKFGGKIYGIEAGNDGNRIILDMIAKPRTISRASSWSSSEAGMLTQAEKAPIKDNSGSCSSAGRRIR
jgi:glycine betaine/proline transport system substrate-binding protein